MVRETTDYLDDPLFNALAEPSDGQEETAAEEAGAEGQQAEIQEQNLTDQKPAVDLSGKWMIGLNGSSTGSLDLIMINSGSSVSGYGNLTESGSVYAVTARGTLTEPDLTLEIRPVTNGDAYNAVRLFQLKLALAGQSLAGTYQIYQSEELVGRGNATATRNG
ncbi:MAG: hypothetical protein GKC10_02485 [Methanosarcinales archaeon]|nr:hypothetical protein [Methanosarcinales archaeon]